MGRAVPVLIGFLASLLGIGGLADKVLGVIRKIRPRIKNAIVKFWNFVKGKAGKLLSKIGIGNKDKKCKVKKEKETRTQEEKKKDLDDGVKEGTKLLKNDSLTSEEREREKDLKTIKQTYELKELKIVTDKVEKNRATVHIHGEVNPILDGNRIVVDFQRDQQLSTDEKNILIKLPGGQEKLDEIIDIEKGGSSKAKHEYAEVRTALDALETGQLNVKIGTHIFASIGAPGNLTEIDVLTQDEMIEVKSGGKYNDAKKLSGRDYDQFLIFRDIFNGKRKVFDSHGNLIIPP